ncbi:MAG TPA: hypothetical protein VMG11_03520 [Steroidobacteraceae bacterium]|nr:hypothetical protein [Steroidobacteraceae bacterium]
MLQIDQLHAQAERIRASGVLGRSHLTRRLFDFLVDCSLTGRAPKEIEVAIDVFGKDAAFDVSQDAMVRVYVHKLRRKLEEFYSGPGRDEPERLIIPKGTYRFALERPEDVTAPDSEAPRRRPAWLVAALAVSIIANALLLAAGAYMYWRRGPDELRATRSSPVWSRILNDDRTIFLVLGDYYIFGETDRSMEVKRLIREFSINSPSDLDQYLKLHPERADQYLDLQLNYLPTSTAFALRDLMPLLAPANRRIRVALASDINPAMLTSAHIIYVGYLSGMGMLHDLVFAGSRFSTGDSYDELIEHGSGHRYISQAAVPHGEEKYHDYGYFASFSGPSGNQIMVIAGTRDVALMHTAEAVTRAPQLEQLVTSAGGAQSFEALYDVYGLDRMNLDGKLLMTSKLNTARIWTGEPARDAGTDTVGRSAQSAPPAELANDHH